MNVAFIGLKGTGKTTCAKILTEALNYQSFAYGDEVKNIGRIILKKEIDKATDVPLLQDLGQLLKKPVKLFNKAECDLFADWLLIPEFKDYYKKNLSFINQQTFYVDKLNEDNNYVQAYDNGNAVVHDMRFIVEEKDFKKDNNSIIIYLKSENWNIKRRLEGRDGIFKKEWFDDISEQEHLKINYDLIFNNNFKNRNQLKQQLIKEINNIKKELVR